MGLRRGWAEVLELGEVLGKMREPAGSGLGACLTGAGKQQSAAQQHYEGR